MASQTANIVSYVLNTISLCLGVFCLFKIFNLTRKITSVSNFINGEVFSERFETMLSNYFAEMKNAKFVIEPILPWLRTALDETEKSPANSTPIARLGGTFFVD